ncbi:MAG: MFS transporter [Porticoccaceae bacterium]
MTVSACQDKPGVVFSENYLGYVVGLLFLVNVLNYMDRSVIGVLIEPMREEFGFSDTQIGLLTGFAFALFYATAGIFIASLSDRYSRRWIVSLSIAAFSVMTALCGAAQNFWQLLFARFGVGVGEASVVPGSLSLLSDYFSPARRALVLGIFSSGSMVGVMAGSVLGGWVADSYGWRWAFVAAALPGIPLALVLAWTLRDPQRGASDGVIVTEVLPLVTALKTLLSSRALLLIMLGLALIAFMLFGMLTWFPALMVRQYGFTLSQTGMFFGVTVGIGTVLGSLGGGWLANKLAVQDLRWLTRMPMLLVLMLWPLYEIAIFASDYRVALAALMLVNIVGGATFGPAAAALQSVIPANLRATGSALNAFLTSLIGIGAAPLIIGILSDFLENKVDNIIPLQWAMGTAAFIALLAFVVMIFADRAFADHLDNRGND